MIESGWRHAAAPALDKLLGAACLLHDEVAAAAATQLLCSAPAHIAAAFPGLADAPARVHRCALHALEHFCPPTDLDMSLLLFVDVRKSQASLFFGEAAAGGAAVLRPAAARASGANRSGAGVGHGSDGVDGEAPAHAQLVGLAQHCDMRVCITSRLPVTVRLTSLSLHLQHVVHKTRDASAAGEARRHTHEAAAYSSQHGGGTAHAGGMGVAGTGSLLRDDLSHGLSGGWADQTEDAVSASGNNTQQRGGHRRTTSSWRSMAVPQEGAARSRHGGAGTLHRETLSGNSAELTSAPAQRATNGPDGAILRDWSDGYVLDCGRSDADSGSVLAVPPGDTYVTFSACPVQEGVHLLDIVHATLDSPAAHSLFIEARCADDVADGAADAATLAGAPCAQSLGAALVATASEENIAVGTAIPGGALFEACCQWLGVRLSRIRGEVRDISVRVSLRAGDGGAPVEFARAVSTGAPGSSDAVNGSANSAAPEAILGVPDRALYGAAGECAELAVAPSGEMELPGSLEREGVLWLPVVCCQQPRTLELVDIGEEGMGAGEAEDARHGAATEATADVAVTYWAGCCRSKHVRLRVPVQVRERFMQASGFAVSARSSNHCRTTFGVMPL
jgi:hypothetical protein